MRDRRHRGQDQKSGGDRTPAIVLEVSARHAVVLANGERLRCIYRNELFREGGTGSRPVAAGDQVMISRPAGSDPTIEEVRPRQNWISRASKGSSGEQVIVANPARLLIVASAAEPGFRPRLVDRLLATAERASAPAIVAINKIDLAESREPFDDWARLYRKIGYAAELVSVRTGEGVDAVRAHLGGGGITVVAGQSGVGKSSLVSAVIPGLSLKAAPVSQQSQKGQHTTTRVTLHPFGEGAFLADSPGVRSFALAEAPGPDLGHRFRDFTPFIDACKYRNCLHTDEPECAVRAAVERGEIDQRRYESYERIARGDDSDVPRDE
jgi:ribosome biogenesis GTPase / thiamine phosphate phosphatase